MKWDESESRKFILVKQYFRNIELQISLILENCFNHGKSKIEKFQYLHPWIRGWQICISFCRLKILYLFYTFTHSLSALLSKLAYMILTPLSNGKRTFWFRSSSVIALLLVTVFFPATHGCQWQLSEPHAATSCRRSSCHQLTLAIKSRRLRLRQFPCLLRLRLFCFMFFTRVVGVYGVCCADNRWCCVVWVNTRWHEYRADNRVMHLYAVLNLLILPRQ